MRVPFCLWNGSSFFIFRRKKHEEIDFPAAGPGYDAGSGGLRRQDPRR